MCPVSVQDQVQAQVKLEYIAMIVFTLNNTIYFTNRIIIFVPSEGHVSKCFHGI